MTNSEQSTLIQSVLQEFTTEIGSSLREFAQTNGLTGKFLGGVMPGGGNFPSGSVFYLPNADPNEEGVGAEWDFEKDSQSEKGFISVWLGWSYGEILKEYCDRKSFSWKSDIEMADKLRDILWGLKAELLSDLRKEILIPRAPFYRVGW